jgi:pyruvate/2-oxoacid:ferredoxin oxidoreductase beta subunit
MNTGIQRSSATPVGAWTTTTPAGSLKERPKKDIENIMLGHHIPYIATASIAYPDDMYRKFKKVRNIMGTKFIHVLSPCPPGWGIDPSKTVQIARLATQSKVFPLYEVENGKHKINIYPESDIGVKDYVRTQGRFRLMTEEMVSSVQESVDRVWEDLLKKDSEA